MPRPAPRRRKLASPPGPDPQRAHAGGRRRAGRLDRRLRRQSVDERDAAGERREAAAAKRSADGDRSQRAPALLLLFAFVVRGALLVSNRHALFGAAMTFVYRGQNQIVTRSDLVDDVLRADDAKVHRRRRTVFGDRDDRR